MESELTVYSQTSHSMTNAIKLIVRLKRKQMLVIENGLLALENLSEAN